MKPQSTFSKILKSSKLGLILLVGGLVSLIIFSVAFSVDSKATSETTAEITKITQTTIGEDITYNVFVKYTIDGTEYNVELGAYAPTYAVGKIITIQYDPANPAKPYVKSVNTIFIVIAVALIVLGTAIVIMTAIKVIKNNKEMMSGEFEKTEEFFKVDETSEKSDFPKTYYFQYNLKPVKQAYVLEDKNRKVLVRADLISFSLTTGDSFTFTDCNSGKVTKALVGHTDNASFDSITTNSTISFDGKDIWRYLSQLGISVSLNKLSLKGTSYEINYNGQTLGIAYQTSKYVHEEDEEQHPTAKNIPVQGFFRLETNEENLKPLFLAMFTLSKTDFSMRTMIS